MLRLAFRSASMTTMSSAFLSAKMITGLDRIFGGAFRLDSHQNYRFKGTPKLGFPAQQPAAFFIGDTSKSCCRIAHIT